VDSKWLREINRFAERPDLAIYLDIPAEISLGRIKRRKSVLENLELQRRVREQYLQLVQAGELMLVDATQSMKKVAENIIGLVDVQLREQRP